MMNRILLVIGFLVCVFSSFAAESPKNYRDTIAPVACQAPQGLFASARDTVASLNWLSYGSNVGYAIQWKLKNDNLWKTAEVTQNTYLLRGIKSCSEYEFRVKTLCGLSGMSDYSESKKFKTSGCIMSCTTPREIQTEMGETKAYFKWASSNSRAYEIQIQDASNNGDWKTEIVAGNAFAALNLKPCTKYNFHVRSICSDATTATTLLYSEWSSAITVATTGCAAPCLAPRKIAYAVTATATVIKWDTTRGATYEIQVMNLQDSVWKTYSGITKPSYELAGLPNCTAYQARVRVICSNSTNLSPWSYTIRFKTGGCQEPCKIPTAVKVYVADTVAVFSWVSPNVSKFIFQYKAEGDINWKSLNTTTNIYILTGLNRCKKYVARVQTVCNSTASSDFSSEIKFETRCEAVCIRPLELKADIVSDTIAVVYWTGTLGSYEIQYRIATETAENWKSVKVANPAHKLVLEKCKTYYWRVRKLCDGTVAYSDWSELGKFETSGCTLAPACIAPKSLKSEIGQDTIVYLNWIGQASTYEIQYQIAGATDWRSAKVQAQVHKLVLPKCNGFYWRVRAVCDNSTSDWSELGKFETKGCLPTPVLCLIPVDLKSLVVTDTVASLSWIGLAGKYEIQYQAANTDSASRVSVIAEGNAHRLILKHCTAYYWRVRRLCDNNAMSDWSALAKFETTGCPVIAPCQIPTGLTSTVLNDTVGGLIWAISTTSAKYDVQYRVKGSGDAGWVTVNVANVTPNGYRLTGLKRCTTYEWKMRQYCIGTVSDWSTIQYFTTMGCTPVLTCLAPIGLVVKGDATGLAYALWTDSYIGDSVLVQYRLVSDTSWTNAVSSSATPNGVLLRGLVNCKEYKVRARRKCANGLFSDWSEIAYKQSVGCLIVEDVTPSSLLRKSTVAASTVYPNPGKEYIQVAYELTETADVKVQMVNVQGQVVKQLDNSIQDAGNYMQVMDNLNDVQQGLYFIIIRTDGKVSVSQKWMKQ
jgi:trimeric autotransporter adhesin